MSASHCAWPCKLNEKMPGHFSRDKLKQDLPFWLLVIFLTMLFLTGGSPRADVQSLVFVRPVSVLVLGIGLWWLTAQRLRQHRFHFAIAIACLLLALLHVVPLPPAIWQALPGRELATEVERAAGLSNQWRPITLTPGNGWNAVFAIFPPLATLVLACQLDANQRSRLLPVILIAGLASGVLGLLQATGAGGGALQPYRITNSGAATGLFANRNHQAFFLLCMFPMLALYASGTATDAEQARLRAWLALLAGAIIIPLLFVTGSRAGLLLGLFAIATVPLIHAPPSFGPTKRKGRKINLKCIFLAGAVVALGFVSVLLSRAQAFERLTSVSPGEELRFKMWGPIAEAAWRYFPVGSGNGSFVEVYQIFEPHDLLGKNYVNHAHNDLLEIWLTTGLPGVLIILVVMVAVARLAWSAFGPSPHDKRALGFLRTGVTLMVLAAVASFFDYPLRTPSLAAFFVIAAVWASGAQRRLGETKRSGVA